MLINPSNPVYNTIIFYILLICIVLLTKPSIMYCHKTNKFKPFGCGEGQTVFSFPAVSIASGIILYIFFLGIEVVHDYLAD